MADALGTPGPPGGPGVVSAVDHRLDQAGLIAAQTSSLAVRTGVMAGPGTAALVTGTSATGTMTVSIAAHHWVSTRGTADGVYLGTKEASTTVNISAAPGANSRIDVVYSRQKDQYSPISPDGASAEEYGVVTGTAAVSPTKPALTSVPGALELATVTVAAGATSTNGAGVTITNTALQTVARGAPIPVRNQAERDALASAWGTSGALTVKRLDVTGRPMEEWDGTDWRRYAFEVDSGPVTLTPASGWTVGSQGCRGRQVGKVFFFQSHLIASGAKAANALMLTFPTAYRPPSPWREWFTSSTGLSCDVSPSGQLLVTDVVGDGGVVAVSGSFPLS